MADAGFEETEKLLKALEKRISKEYKQASEEAQQKLDDYLRRFEIKDRLKKKALDAKLISKHDYTEWRKQQIMVQERWTALRNELAENYHNANKIAKSITKGYMPEVYAINHNYGTYQIERDAGVNTSYTLYNAEAVERLMRDNPQILPDPFGAPQEVWNCRCSTRAVVEGLESKSHATRDLSATDSGDYEEWKKGHSKPNPIDLPEKKAAAAKAEYVKEYKGYANLPDVITNTPKKPSNPSFGCKDVTERWLRNANPGQGSITNVTRFMQDGKEYKIDGENVRFNSNSKGEMEMAELWLRTRGGTIQVMPEVNGKYKHVSTPDYIIDGRRYDLKTIEGSSKRKIDSIVHQHEDQADNFIFDITEKCSLSIEELVKQAEEVFNSQFRTRVNSLIFVQDGNFLKILTRR
mgnify:FL=1